MPRGVPKSGHRRKPSPKSTPQVAVAGPKPVAPPEAVAPAQPIAVARPGPVRSQDIDSLAGDTLRNYARSIGVSGRDCIGLTEDRLRQNCKLFLNEHFQALSE